MKSINDLIHKLSKNPIEKTIFLDHLTALETIYENSELEFELLIANGLPLIIQNNSVLLKTSITPLCDQIFCAVDIETNGNKTDTSQIIEIGAVKFCNNKVIETYESLVYTHEIEEYITTVTGITAPMTHNAPSIHTVLEEFKIFLEDAVFVAHNASFDYNFISASLENYHLGKLQNRHICTINLAKKFIQSEKYGLETLKELLGIKSIHHRAMSDAQSSFEIFKYCMTQIPAKIHTTEDLIKFCAS